MKRLDKWKLNEGIDATLLWDQIHDVQESVNEILLI